MLTLSPLHAKSNGLTGYDHLIKQTVKQDIITPNMSMEEYYTAHGTPPGYWLGSSLEHLNIAHRSTVSTEQLKNLLRNNSHPNSGELLGKRNYTEKSVSGYDMVFTPVKSIKILWGLSDNKTQKTIEACHSAAVQETLKYIEKNAIYTYQREKNNPDNRVLIKTSNTISAAFKHYDTRKQDPDLHTHLVIANKTYLNGNWYAVDGRILHKYNVAASEYYTSILESYLKQRLNINFVNKYNNKVRVNNLNKSSLIPIREVEGISNEIIEFYSKRSQDIRIAFNKLISDYVATHGKYPSIKIQQQYSDIANLSTRDRKLYGRSLEDQIKLWRSSYKEKFNKTDKEIDRDFSSIVNRNSLKQNKVTEYDIEKCSNKVLDIVSKKYNTFNKTHIIAESQRQSRQLEPSPKELLEIANKIIDKTLSKCLKISDNNHPLPYYTKRELLNLENNIVRYASYKTNNNLCNNLSNTDKLSDQQNKWIHNIANSTTRITIGIGVAGAGKSTSLLPLKESLVSNNKNIISTAFSANAAKNLGDSIKTDYYTIDYLKNNKHKITDDTVVIIDEVSMVNTSLLHSLIENTPSNSKFLLIGDTKQIQAIDGSTPLSYLTKEKNVTPYILDEVHRFNNKQEANATLKIRNGDIKGLDFYKKHNRISRDSQENIYELITDNYINDINSGKSSILLGKGVEEISLLNQLVQSKLDNLIPTKIKLSDDNLLCINDKVVNRVNDYKENIRNGETYIVRKINEKDNTALLENRFNNKLYIPINLLRNNFELGYASTIFRSQGLTVDTSHTLVKETMGVYDLYVGLSRGKESNKLYISDKDREIIDISTKKEEVKSTDDIFKEILGNNDIKYSSRELLKEELKHNKHAQTRLKIELSNRGLINDQVIQNISAVIRSINYNSNNEGNVEKVILLNEILSKRKGLTSDTDVLFNKYIINLIERRSIFCKLYSSSEIAHPLEDISDNLFDPEAHIKKEQKYIDDNSNNIKDKLMLFELLNKQNVIDKDIDFIHQLALYINQDTHITKVKEPYIINNKVNNLLDSYKLAIDGIIKDAKDEIKKVYDILNNSDKKLNIWDIDTLAINMDIAKGKYGTDYDKRYKYNMVNATDNKENIKEKSISTNDTVQKFIDNIKEFIKANNIKYKKVNTISKESIDTLEKYIGDKNIINNVSKGKLKYLYTLLEIILLAKVNIKDVILKCDTLQNNNKQENIKSDNTHKNPFNEYAKNTEFIKNKVYENNKINNNIKDNRPMNEQKLDQSIDNISENIRNICNDLKILNESTKDYIYTSNAYRKLKKGFKELDKTGVKELDLFDNLTFNNKRAFKKIIKSSNTVKSDEINKMLNNMFRSHVTGRDLPIVFAKVNQDRILNIVRSYVRETHNQPDLIKLNSSISRAKRDMFSNNMSKENTQKSDDSDKGNMKQSDVKKDIKEYKITQVMKDLQNRRSNRRSRGM